MNSRSKSSNLFDSTVLPILEDDNIYNDVNSGKSDLNKNIKPIEKARAESLSSILPDHTAQLKVAKASIKSLPKHRKLKTVET